MVCIETNAFHPILETAFEFNSSSSSLMSYARADSRRDGIFIEAHQRRHTTHQNNKNGKKEPISYAIEHARYEHLIFTDADCKPNSNLWINKFIRHYYLSHSAI